MNILAADKERLRKLILSFPNNQTHENLLSSEFDDRAVSNIPKSTINRKHKMIIFSDQTLLQSQQTKRQLLKSEIKEYVRQSFKKPQIEQKAPSKAYNQDQRQGSNTSPLSKLPQKPSHSSHRAKKGVFGNLASSQSQIFIQKVLNNICCVGTCEISKESPKRSVSFRKRVYNSPNLGRSNVQSSALSQRKHKRVFRENSQKEGEESNPECEVLSIEPWQNEQDFQIQESFYRRRRLPLK